jgi:hypothetical protein
VATNFDPTCENKGRVVFWPKAGEEVMSETAATAMPNDSPNVALKHSGRRPFAKSSRPMSSIFLVLVLVNIRMPRGSLSSNLDRQSILCSLVSRTIPIWVVWRDFDALPTCARLQVRNA